MENNNIENSIREDKALVEKLFTKEALDSFEGNNSNIPYHYFESFESRLLNNIHTKKHTTPIIKFTKWGQFAIAASFLTIILSTYFLLQTNTIQDQNKTIVRIQEIPNAQIDAYISTNESLAEIDWQEEINVESTHLESLNNHLIKDSNNSQ